MVASIVIPLIDIAVSIALVMTDVCAQILVASIRPWHYFLSKPYRASVDVKFADRPVILKLCFLAWGTLLALASLAIVVFVISWVIMQCNRAPSPMTEKQKIVRMMQSAAEKSIENRRAAGN